MFVVLLFSHSLLSPAVCDPDVCVRVCVTLLPGTRVAYGECKEVGGEEEECNTSTIFHNFGTKQEQKLTYKRYMKCVVREEKRREIQRDTRNTKKKLHEGGGHG